MSEFATDEIAAAGVELSGKMEKLEMDETTFPEGDHSEGDTSPQTIGADEAKDSESAPAESSNRPVKDRVFVGGISWRTTDTELRVQLVVLDLRKLALNIVRYLHRSMLCRNILANLAR